MTHAEVVSALPFEELPLRWQRPVRWLLGRLAAWADEVERDNIRGSSFFWHCDRQTWERRRLQKMRDIMASVRLYAETARHIRSGGRRYKPQRLGRILRILKSDLSESPFAGRFSDWQGIGAEHDATICGKFRNKVYSRSRKVCGCFVWLERDEDAPQHWFWPLTTSAEAQAEQGTRRWKPYGVACDCGATGGAGMTAHGVESSGKKNCKRCKSGTSVKPWSCADAMREEGKGLTLWLSIDSRRPAFSICSPDGERSE